MSVASAAAVETTHEFTLLTNHALVLLVIAQRPDVRMREIALLVGITERAVQRIVDDLTATGYVIVTKDGRRNRYSLQAEMPLRHPLGNHCTVGDLLRIIDPQFAYGLPLGLDRKPYALSTAKEEVLL